MRKINTRRFGEMEIEENKIMHFEHGLPAFEDEHEFVLVPFEENSAYLFMQSVNTPDLSFLVTIPYVFFRDYQFSIDDSTVENLGLTSHEDVEVYVIITIPAGQARLMTANLLAPVIVNKHTLKAKQVVLERTRYKTKHRLFPDVKEGAE